MTEKNPGQSLPERSVVIQQQLTNAIKGKSNTGKRF